MCADQKKRERKKKSMSWIIQWLGSTPKVSALWPLGQEVKGSAVDAGINGADMFWSSSQSDCERGIKLALDFKSDARAARF